MIIPHGRHKSEPSVPFLGPTMPAVINDSGESVKKPHRLSQQLDWQGQRTGMARHCVELAL